MDATNALLTKDPITAFCECEIASHHAKWPVDEGILAIDFLESFSAKDCVIYEQLADLCVRLSIQVSLADLSEGHSGINCCYGEKRAIAVNQRELPGLNREHALLPELREILEYKFRELNHPIALKNDLEVHAEVFATAIRLHTGLAICSVLIDAAKTVSTPWKRTGAYILIGAGVLGHFYLTIFPGLEYGTLSDSAKQRVLREQRKRCQ